MHTSCLRALPLVLALLLAETSHAQETPRKTYPFAPSLPVLTREENARIDAVINRFILYDSGQLADADGEKILEEFEALGPEATVRLLWGLNRAANLQASCPAVIIGRKLTKLINRSEEHTSELQSRQYLVCRLLLEKKKNQDQSNQS